MTHDDVSHLLHLPVEDRLLYHTLMTEAWLVGQFMGVIRFSPTKADWEVENTKWDHLQFTLLKGGFERYLLQQVSLKVIKWAYSCRDRSLDFFGGLHDLLRQ